jgi:hypothetical protein
MEVESAPLAAWETGKSESIKPAVKEGIKHGTDALVRPISNLLAPAFINVVLGLPVL